MENWLSVFKALGDETRLNMIALLCRHGFCVGALARLVGVSEASASSHIRVLRQAGLLTGQKRGGYTFYSVNEDALGGLAKQLDALASVAPKRSECCHFMTGEHQYCEIYGQAGPKAGGEA